MFTSVVSGEGFASVYLENGINVVRFKYKGNEVACVLDVHGGEVYTSVSESDLVPIIRAHEER